ncbi:MAG: hypothetical protein ACFFDP_03765 [Promethearchaeota archaeon]
MRVKALIVGLKELVAELNVEGWQEFRTPDGTRIDFAITRGSERLLAIEFERSRKWLFARVLYNAVKAQRAEFPSILFVYPYYDLPRAGRSWVPTYVEDNLNLRLALCHPRDCFAATRKLIAEQLNVPTTALVTEKDRVIVAQTENPKAAPGSLLVGAKAWERMKNSSVPKLQRRKRRKTRTPRKKATK